MVIRWRRQTGRWMKIMWLNELSVFSGSNFRPVSRIKYWQSMSLQTARAWTHWHSAQNFSFPVYIAFFFFFFFFYDVNFISGAGGDDGGATGWGLPCQWLLHKSKNTSKRRQFSVFDDAEKTPLDIFLPASFSALTVLTSSWYPYRVQN